MSTPTKHVFVTGGVASGLGKGITASSLGRLLKARGLRVRLQKLDPYLNVDPGTLNPVEHGEVFVTDDGAETDLDLGHYERFVDEDLTSASNATSGSIYSQVIAAERRGDFDGHTVQVIPHITNEIRRRISTLGTRDVDVVITEVGGTVGDIEILPFLEAIRQFRNTVGRANVCAIHVSLVPYIGPSGEHKTKPTQHSVTELRARGISPDVIVARSSGVVDDHVKQKIANLCDVETSAVIGAADCPNIYAIPLAMHAEGFDQVVCDVLHLKTPEPELGSWITMVQAMTDAEAGPELRVGLVGKYVRLHDSYLSVVESLRHAGAKAGVRVHIDWIDAEELEGLEVETRLAGLDALVVPGGFGHRGTEGKIAAVRWAREHHVPCLGLCLGMQVMVIDAARHLAGLTGANSAEFAHEGSLLDHPVIDLMRDQRGITQRGGTMRLGAYFAVLQPGTLVEALYGAAVVSERHRHRYEVNPDYRGILESVGLRCSGVSPDNRLVEFVELEGHPFFVGTQAHPELKSRPERPAPLFVGLVRAAQDQLEQRRTQTR